MACTEFFAMNAFVRALSYQFLGFGPLSCLFGTKGGDQSWAVVVCFSHGGFLHATSICYLVRILVLGLRR